jgi:hypothetical protein
LLTNVHRCIRGQTSVRRRQNANGKKISRGLEKAVVLEGVLHYATTGIARINN